MPQFVSYPHPALGRPAVRRAPDEAMRQAGALLLDAAKQSGAYGLAAAHLGLDEPVVVISVAEDVSVRDYRLLYNPVVLQTSDVLESGPEGSVSLPGIEVPVMRAIWAEIGYDDADGVSQRDRFEGFVARVALHEIDQVDGLFFLRRVSPVKRDMALRKFQKITRS